MTNTNDGNVDQSMQQASKHKRKQVLRPTGICYSHGPAMVPCTLLAALSQCLCHYVSCLPPRAFAYSLFVHCRQALKARFEQKIGGITTQADDDSTNNQNEPAGGWLHVLLQNDNHNDTRT